MNFPIFYTAFLACCFGMIVFLFTTSFMDDLVYSILPNVFRTEMKYPPVTANKFKRDTIDTENLASSVWCLKRLDGSRLCSFKNLYHLPQHKGYLLFILNENSIISGVESSEALKEINLSTVQNHTGIYLKLVIVKSSEYLLKQSLVFLDNDVIILKRFKPDNIMHVIHDDLLPLFVTFQELCKGNIQLCLSTYQLVILDDSDEGPYSEWYTYFSHYNVLFLTKENFAVCIRKSVIGLSLGSVWFQYGFKSNQGPIENSNFSGFQLRQFTEFVKQQFGFKSEGIQSLNEQELRSIVFLSRKINRKILNDYIVENRVKEIYQSVHHKPVGILNVDVSTNSSKNLISSLQSTNMLIGMHGSAMILSIFLPQGSNIIELFPFAIQPEFVSPLKALCSLPNMFYNYRAWVNTNESNTRTHPEYSSLHGGIVHLPFSEQENIMKIRLVPPVECCHNPVYLFRMFQDTIVDESFYTLVFSVFINENSRKQNLNDRAKDHIYNLWYYPPPILNLSCECANKKLMILWKFPFSSSSKVKFSIATSTGIMLVTELTNVVIEMAECENDKNELESQTPVSVWVKTLEGTEESIDSYMQCIVR